MKHSIFILLSILLLTTHTLAQEIRLNPSPQEIVTNNKLFPLPTTIRLIGADEANPQAVNYIRTVLGNRVGTLGYPLYIGEKGDKNIRKFKKMIPEKSEGYYLSIDDNQMVIAGNDERGTFYAVQTLAQLLKAKADTDSLRSTVPMIEVKDYPDIRFRGVVEGFYGTPWSHEARLRQLQFYGENKMNTYIYGPKDDPYHSTPHWRLPYPAKEAEQLKELIREAKKNEVDFVWAIHPGQDIQWTDEDRNQLITKFEAMYQLGIRSFAVFFDDISGQGTDANHQADMLNYLDNHFVKVKKEVTPLIMCPTEYNKSWSNPQGNYLTTLGDKLNPGIQIMWTGDRVISDMSAEGLNWINERIKRPAYIWWNFPVSDYVRDHLLMGAVYGNEKGIEQKMSGFVSNPMERAEASKIALYGVANYTWNMKKYDAQQTWENAIHTLLPDAGNALYTFCKHNSDLGQNGHKYRREESIEIQPVVERFAKRIQEKEEYDINDFIKLKAEFDQIIISSNLLLTSKNNTALIEEIKPWLYQFRLLGEMGNEALVLSEVLKHGLKDVFEQRHAHFKALQQLSYETDLTFNQNPYQPGVKTGTKVLSPFIDSLFAITTQYFNDKYHTQLSTETYYSPHKLFCDIEQLRNQPLQTKNEQVLITPLLEVVKWPAEKYIELSFDKVYPSFTLDIDFGSKQLPAWGKLEISIDGQNWQPTKLSKEEAKIPVKAIRFINAGNKEEQIHLRKFAVRLGK